MNKVEFFCPMDIFFGLVDGDLRESKATVVFRRFRGPDTSSAYHVVDDREYVGKVYNDGGYRKIYFSVGSAPENDKDWDFVEREKDSLLELSGGRSRGCDLEISVLRVVSKASSAKRLFSAMRASIERASDAGGAKIFSTPYPKVRYVNEARNYDLYNDIDNKDFLYRIK